MQMRTVIISGGAITNYEFIKAQLKDDDIIICADSGYNHAANMRLQVNVVVGDFDSIGNIPQDIPVVRYPAKKDLTDTELAIEHARNMGSKHFLLIAATGSRLDHTITNILLLKNFLARGEHSMIIDEHNKIMLTDSQLRLYEPPGSIVSLVPLSDCLGVTTEGLEYPLHNATLYIGKGLGVSNVMLEGNASVSVQDGLLLVIIARD
ncbi:MAG: thiamine diphosphokinase [Defluviitaleaceae bacterium]|nr:thiamine diphosphokinase [Defluviitaleaceae bacterium]